MELLEWIWEAAKFVIGEFYGFFFELWVDMVAYDLVLPVIALLLAAYLFLNAVLPESWK